MQEASLQSPNNIGNIGIPDLFTPVDILAVGIGRAG